MKIAGAKINCSQPYLNIMLVRDYLIFYFTIVNSLRQLCPSYSPYHSPALIHQNTPVNSIVYIKLEPKFLKIRLSSKSLKGWAMTKVRVRAAGAEGGDGERS